MIEQQGQKLENTGISWTGLPTSVQQKQPRASHFYLYITCYKYEEQLGMSNSLLYQPGILLIRIPEDVKALTLPNACQGKLGRGNLD